MNTDNELRLYESLFSMPNFLIPQVCEYGLGTSDYNTLII